MVGFCNCCWVLITKKLDQITVTVVAEPFRKIPQCIHVFVTMHCSFFIFKINKLQKCIHLPITFMTGVRASSFQNKMQYTASNKIFLQQQIAGKRKESLVKIGHFFFYLSRIFFVHQQTFSHFSIENIVLGSNES